jgi:hypothetical protein
VRFRTRPFGLLFVVALACGGAWIGTARGASSPSASDQIQAPTAEELADGTYTCTPAHSALLDDRRQQIAAAATVGDARKLAVGPARVARRALTVAAFVAPATDSFADAKTRLESFEAQVEASASPEEVAARFAELVDPTAASAGTPIQLADLQVGNADVDAGGCNYSTGEIIAVVIGFILFIIPGIILLIVLC